VLTRQQSPQIPQPSRELALGRAEDCTLSYLPLAHIFDRTCEEMFLAVGGRIGYWQGKLAALVDDIAALKPTIFIGVPRVFDKIHNGINDRIAGAGCVKKLLFKWAYGGKLNKLKAGFPSAKAAPFWDKLVFGKVCVLSLLI
jgi:long-chain acyl-CoA synthetase